MTKTLTGLLLAGVLITLGLTLKKSPAGPPQEDKLFVIEVYDQHHNHRNDHTGRMYQVDGLVHVYDVNRDEEYVYHNYKVVASRIYTSPPQDSSLALGM